MVPKEEIIADVIPIRQQEKSVPLPPAQYNLLTREPEPLPLVVDREVEDELRISEDIVVAVRVPLKRELKEVETNESFPSTFSLATLFKNAA